MHPDKYDVLAAVYTEDNTPRGDSAKLVKTDKDFEIWLASIRDFAKWIDKRRKDKRIRKAAKYGR